MTAQVAFLFPGQGSQAIGMGADVYAASAAGRQVFETVDEALGFSLSTLCFQGPDETLRETMNAQPAIVTVSLALLAALQETLSPHNSSWSNPLVPSYTAGHSVGEYAAVVAADALDLKSAAMLVRERGRLMHHEGTVCPGGMAAIIGMEAEPLQALCQEATSQALASQAAGGHPGRGRVIIVIPLAVSGAFHSPVMQPAASGLAQVIATTQVQDARVPIISNITAQPLTIAQDIREELAEQISSSVQWIRTIEYLVQAGVSVFIEIGPGHALTGMIKRISKGVTTVTISSMAHIEKASLSLREIGLLDEI